MRKPSQKQDLSQAMIPQNGDANFQKQSHQHHKPFLFSALHKTVPIGYQLHQVEVPDFVPLSPSIPRQQLPPPLSPAVFKRSQVNEEELEQYLGFVESFYQQKIPDYFSQGSTSRDRARTKAMEFLHEMEYNYVRAKFFILFPYYLKYNRYKCHSPLKLSDNQMASRIAQHLESLKSTKQKQLERWIGTVQTSIQSRIHLNKLNTLIQVAKQNKYEIPEAIRQHVQRSIKTGRQIKKALHSTRLPLDKLISKRDSLLECKIITNQMIQYDETVNRCEEWLRKQKNFQQTFFIFDPQPQLIQIQDKIQFRTLQLLVNEFNNLPLIYDQFDKTTGALYQSTINLLDRLPPLNKAAKTRTAQNHTGHIKIGIQSVRQFLKEIQQCPVEHEDFISFQNSVCEHLQWLQRIGMWLQDQKSEKSLKILNQYSKIISDIPIVNKIQYKLQSRLEYYEIMEKVKKDISNPAKYEQIKDAIRKLKEKGYETCQYAKIQTRIISYMGWYESQQILNEDRVPHQTIQLYLRKKNIVQRMIPQQAFEQQLQSARLQLNIPEEVWIESQGKVKNIDELKNKIQLITSCEQSNIFELVDTLKLCIKNGLVFPQFQALYNEIMEIFNVLGQMCFLLLSNYDSLPENKLCFVNRNDVEVIMSVLYEHRESWELKQLQTKEGGDIVLEKTKRTRFPRHLPQYQMYLELMEKSEAWNIKAQNLINAFKQQAADVNIRELIEESKSCLHSKGIQEELNKIDIVLRWKQKISRKLSDHRQSPFEEEDKKFMLKLQKDLCQIQSIQQCGQKMKTRALDYLFQNGRKLTATLEKISTIQIQCTYKLSEMNKFLKQIDREIEKYKLEDKNILRLREQLHQQLLLSDQWKQRYLSVKRFEKKKLKKEDQQIKEVQIEIQCDENNRNGHSVASDGILQVPYVPQLLSAPSPGKRKYYIKNGQFCWYFKLPLMILEFYNGYHLKFAIEDQVRLRGILSDVFRFIQHYTELIIKQDKTDHQLLSLEAQGTKIPFFFRESYVLTRKNQYLTHWKQIADSILKSVPVLNMELKARKPEQLLELLEQKKMHKDEGKEEGGRGEQMGNKRKRKQNTFYSNEDMTLITEETFGLKAKKKRKGNNPDQQYRNTAVASTAKKLARSQKQDVERAEALLAGEVPAQLIQIDDPKEYCICRYGVPNENSVMIQCEHRCTEWYHIECLGIKKHQTKSDVKWKCVGCKALYKQESLGYFFWDSHAKISYYALKQLVEEGRTLEVETQQLKKLEVLFTKVENWRSSTAQMLKRVCDTIPEELHLLEGEIYELFLHSLWLPIYHTESKILRKLVLLARQQY